jgi:multiple antibiotic resistance protein
VIARLHPPRGGPKLYFMHEALHAFLLGFPALFSIVNPPSAAFIFREVTADRTHEERVRIARRVGVYALLVMVSALWAGSYVLGFFGITLAALRVAGGLVVAASAWDLLRMPERHDARKQEQAQASEGSEDISFFPLTLPITTGPGTIAVAIALSSGRPESAQIAWFLLGTTGAAVAMALAIWLTFRFADRIVDMLGPTGSRIVTRLAAFLLLCIGVQILIGGVADVLGPMLAAR